MIVKQPRDDEGHYNLKITDTRGKSFIMMVGGNMDLYWVPENYQETQKYEINKKDELVFTIFNQLFNKIKDNDDQYRPVVKGNILTFISEEWAEDESNILKIIKNDKSFEIEFIKSEKRSKFCLPSKNCPICFCNSGSRVPRVESYFMRMFTYLAYYCEWIKCEDEYERGKI